MNTIGGVLLNANALTGRRKSNNQNTLGSQTETVKRLGQEDKDVVMQRQEALPQEDGGGGQVQV